MKYSSCVILLIPFFLSCGTDNALDEGKSSLSLTPVDQNGSSIGGRYKFLGGDCGISGETTVIQTGDSIKINQGGQTLEGNWSLSQDGKIVVDYNSGEEIPCLGVFQEPLLFISCHSTGWSCTMNWEQTEAYVAQYLEAAKYITTTVIPDVSGEVGLVSTNCPQPEIVPDEITINQIGNEIQVYTELGSFTTVLGNHGQKSASGLVKYNEDTACYGISGGNKMVAVCVGGNRSCGVQYVYR